MIQVDSLTKTYKLYKHQNDRLKEALSLSHKKYHKEFYALKNLSFSIKSGEIVGIIGNNGSGKSTLLKLITGVLTPSSGTINLNAKVTALLELGAGFNPELTGLENIYLHGSINGYSKDVMQAKLDDIVNFAEIGAFIHQPIKTYSSGMKSRLAFSLAINVDPEIFIIDEVLSVGDAAFQRKCFAKMESFKEQGKTILFVSHSASQIVQLCHRAIWLSHGQKVLEGESKLVVGLYQKYGASKELDFKSIRDEYETKLLPIEEETQEIQTAFINPELKASSTICYEENGAQISNVKLKTLQLQEINTLQKNSYYYYTYDVIFDKAYKEVNLAMLIKTTSGIGIGGKELSLIKDKILSNIEAKKKYSVKWKFLNILNAGTYFFNCGVNTIIDEKKVVLHRILDAYMFEVQQDNNDKANNIIDFSLSLHVNESK